MTHGNGSLAQHDYDAAGRLTALRNLKSDSSVISIFTYSYDNVGNRSGVQEASGDLVTWSYDEAYQLTREQRSGANAYDVTYSYDSVGNRLKKLEGGATTTYSYDAANQLNTSEDASGVTTFTYDANGNTEVKIEPSAARTTYSWSIENMLAQVTLPDSSVATFTYDGDKRRRSKTEAGTVTNFLRDRERVILETDSGGTMQAHYTLPGGGWLSPLLSMRRSGVSSFYHLDALGSADRLTNAAEAVTDWYLYKAFGINTVVSGSTVNPFRFVAASGYYRDFGTRLLHLGLRYYEPRTGRFVNLAPILDSINRYIYANADPIQRIDPSGLVDWKRIWELIDRVLRHLNKLWCAFSIARRARNKQLPPCCKNAPSLDKFRHCWASCEIARQCGLIPAASMGALKELIDLIPEPWIDKLPIPQKLKDLLKGNPEWMDLLYDALGMACKVVIWKSCDDCCCGN